MYKRKVEFEYVLDQVRNSLSDISKELVNPYKDLSDIRDSTSKESSRKRLDISIVNIANVVSIVEEYKQLMNSIDREYKYSTEKEIEDNKLKLSEYQGKIDRLILENERLNELNNKFSNKIIEMAESFIEGADLNNKAIKEFNSRVEGAINQIALKEYMQTDDFKSRDRSGEKAPGFRQDVDSEEIESLYGKGVTIRELAKKYGMTENGMRLRVKSLGIWKDGRYKTKEAE